VVDRPFSDDVWGLIRSSPYLQLAKPRGAEPFLRRQVSLAEECRSGLADYPRVRVEPLEFFYTCLRSLGALRPVLLEAFVRDGTWRGVVWGAWLAILEPDAQFLPILGGVRGIWPHNDWLVQCAVAAIRTEGAPPAHQPVLELGARCRELLRGVKRPVTPLRSEPTDDQLTLMNRERELVRSAYASGGAAAARAVLPGTLLEFYGADHASWAARGYPAPTPSPAERGV
jgi:hypothetical protein